jgi:hypothetical protein
VPAGLGQITTTNYNGDPCDNYYNIFLNPLFQNPASYNFYLTENSPCIDAGDPSVLDPDMTISDIGAYYYDQVGAGIGTPFIILEPDTSTLMVPAQGDTVEFTVFAGYNPGWDLVDFWITLTYPDSQTVDTLLFIRQDVYVHQQDTLVRYPQYIVPPEAPSGTYTITGRGGIYPDTIQCEDSFTFEKLSSEGNYLANLPLEQIPPTTVALFAFPNPFNPQTTISFNLPQAGEVRLIAYDVLGREMAMLFNGFRDAGFYEITWNAENLPSGIYFVRLSVVGGQSAVQKLMLMK